MPPLNDERCLRGKIHHPIRTTPAKFPQSTIHTHITSQAHAIFSNKKLMADAREENPLHCRGFKEEMVLAARGTMLPVRIFLLRGKCRNNVMMIFFRQSRFLG
jgi:hypothetical protein